MRYFETRKARIEIIPMIDIMLFLLVFFVMIVMRMIPGSGIASQLPHSGTADQLPHPKVVVTLLADGTVEIGDDPISLAGLTAKLAGEADPAKTDVTIAGASAVSLQNLLGVMDAVRRAGVTSVGIAARSQN
ncbi:MAG TPA: biopolymer transporter ExbD [Rhodopila sp.]|jgi:biopolymer transport protein ExbD|nr:biopolymer transporter ExbD [Rhodopila sp.]